MGTFIFVVLLVQLHLCHMHACHMPYTICHVGEGRYPLWATGALATVHKWAQVGCWPHWRVWVGLREQKSRKKKKKRKKEEKDTAELSERWAVDEIDGCPFAREGAGYFQTKGSRGNEGNNNKERSETPTSFHCVDPGNENQSTTPGRRPPPLLPFPWSRINDERQQSAKIRMLLPSSRPGFK